MKSMASRSFGKQALGAAFAILISFVGGVSANAAPDPKVIEAAKKEGQLVWYNSIIAPHAQKVLDEFMKKYPFIQATFWRGSGLKVYTKLTTEARTNKFDWDVLSLSDAESILLVKQQGFITAYDSPERQAYNSDVKDDEGYWTGFYALPTGLGFNTNLVRKDEVPKTYQDLLDPKWKGGKISVDTEGEQLLIGLMDAWGKEKAVDYLKKLALQKPAIGRGNSNRIQLAAAGEYPLVIAYTSTIQNIAVKGTPIDWVNLEPVVVKIDALTLGAKSTHPNAGRLLIDFILSEEGQTLMKNLNRAPLRNGVEAKPAKLNSGFKRVVLRPETSLNMKENYELYKKLLGF
jgi:ABC-type Fe3+ transport system substrate-binding protein